ncbi:MAG: hypothetical protein QW486_01100 [Candidatus Bathyarchaeia archaeon]|nr:hypothetical protein [Candidatus Bathyarchaeota archaeon]
MNISSEEDFEATDIRCEISCVESAKKTKREYDKEKGREVEREVWESVTLYSAKPTLRGATKIYRGYREEIPFSIGLPPTGRPTYKSINNNVVWSIKGVIGVDGRPDVVSRTIEIQVAQPSPTPVVKEVIIKEKEVVMIPCKYCGTLMPQTETVCPHCGARRTG